MKTIKNNTGSKAVNISKDGTGIFRAMFIQIYNGEESVQQSKSFKTINSAEKWAIKILN